MPPDSPREPGPIQATATLTVGLLLAVGAAGAAVAQVPPPGLALGNLLFLLAAWGAGIGVIHLLYFWFEKQDRIDAPLDDGRNMASDAPVTEGSPRLPLFGDRLQFILLFLLIILLGVAAGEALRVLTVPDTANATALRLAAILLAGGGFLTFVLLQFSRASARGAFNRLHAVLRLGWVVCVAYLLGAATLFLLLYSGWDATFWLTWAIALLLYALLLEAVVQTVARFYQPAKDREQGPTGGSLLLGWIGGRANPFAVLAENIERSYGVRLQDTWAFRFLLRAAEPLALIAIIILWLSTCLTVVPVQSQAVRVTLGQFATEPVGPGLHLTAPWPFGYLQQVDTQRVRSLEIGYGEDLGGPVLWNERHYAGEKNMLVGDGDEMLTINVPVYYRVADPVVFLRQTEDPINAVSQLASRQLLRAMAGHNSFGVMLAEREAIRDRIRVGLQEEIDRLGLGLEIVFVGLKDIHPPVDVAPAYQDVISAREDKLTYIIDGETYRTRRLPETQADAYRLLTQATAAGDQRILAAQGDTGRFRLVEEAQQAAPALFRTRLLLDQTEATLAAVPKIVIDRNAAAPTGGYLLDLRRLPRDPAPEPSFAPSNPLLNPATQPSPYIDENRPPPGAGGFDTGTDDLILPE